MNWSMFATLSVLAATIHWIVARALIMRWFWGARWLPHVVTDLLECPACFGFWIGIGLGLVGVQPIAVSHTWANALLSGVLAVFGTPIAEGALIWGLEHSRIP